MKGIFFDINRPLQSRLIDNSSSISLGGASTDISLALYKPRREFTLRVWDTMLRDQAELLRNAIHAARVSAVFMFDGDQYGDLQEPIFIADGNGVQLEFSMPFDNVFAPSWLIYENGTLRTDWTMKEEEGVLIFDSSAPTGRLTGKGKRDYRTVIIATDGALLGESQLYTNEDGDGVYSFQPLTLVEVEGVNVA